MSLFKYILSRALKTLVIKIKSINLNTKYKIKRILNYKYINNQVKYYIK